MCLWSSIFLRELTGPVVFEKKGQQQQRMVLLVEHNLKEIGLGSNRMGPSLGAIVTEVGIFH
jgi:hypothetical protein